MDSLERIANKLNLNHFISCLFLFAENNQSDHLDFEIRNKFSEKKIKLKLKREKKKMKNCPKFNLGK